MFAICFALLPSSGTGPGQSIATLPGASGQSCGAPSAIAAVVSLTESSSS